jgi:serine-type D-Ala-D-Ala carboxypeptidase/endopeptidase
MTWAADTERALVDAVGGAAAAIDPTTTAVTPDEHRYEIGSVTKTMTATLLALLAGDGVLRLDNRIGHWLSAGANGAITLRQLATHTSGLPSLPRHRAGGENPLAGYTFEHAEADLPHVTVGTGHRYSNLGYQVLALVLARATGTDFRTLLTDRLLVPLGMTRSAVGGRYPLGAGGVEATIGDLARYARACLCPPPTPLGAAIDLARRPVVDLGAGVAQALAWVVRPDGVCEHSGGTRADSACVAVGHGRAVAILTGEPGGPARSDHLKRVARRVLAGGDPRAVAAARPWPAWRDAVIAVARDLAGGHPDRVHARLVADRRATVTADRLAAAFARRAGDGVAGAITVGHHDLSATGAVVADVTVDYPAGPVRLRVAVLPTGELGGLAFPD